MTAAWWVLWVSNGLVVCVALLLMLISVRDDRRPVETRPIPTPFMSEELRSIEAEVFAKAEKLQRMAQEQTGEIEIVRPEGPIDEPSPHDTAIIRKISEKVDKIEKMSEGMEGTIKL